MQAHSQIAPHAGAPGQPPLLPLGTGQSPTGPGPHGNDFTATLAAESEHGGDLGTGPTGVVAGEALMPALVAFGIGLERTLPAARAAALGDGMTVSTEGRDGRDRVSGGMNPLPGFACSSVSDPAALPWLSAATMLPDGSATPLAGAADRPGAALQGLASADALPARADGPSGQSNKSPQPAPADQSAAPGETVAPVIVQADSAGRAALATMPDASDATHAKPDGAVIEKAFAAEGPGLDVDPLSKKAVQPEPLPQSPDDPNPTEADGPRDTGPGRHPASAEMRGLVPVTDEPAHDHLMGANSPASAAESLWHGAVLARTSASLAPQAGSAALAASGIGVFRTAEAGQHCRLLGANAPALASLPNGPATLPDLQDRGRADMAPRTTASGPAGPSPSLPGAFALSPTNMFARIKGEELFDRDLAASGGMLAGTIAGQPPLVTSQPAGPQPAATLAHMSAHVVAAMARHPEGMTDIALSPEELGRVQMTLQADAQNPDRMVVFLSFDRPETLDLFRRHTDQLAEAIRMAGYSGVDINFGQPGTDAGDGFSPGDHGGEDPQGDGSERSATMSTNPMRDTATNPGGLGAPRSGAMAALDLRM